MNKILLLILLLSANAGCYHGQNYQAFNLETYKCKEAGLRAVGLYTPDGRLYIECRPHIKRKEYGYYVL